MKTLRNEAQSAIRFLSLVLISAIVTLGCFATWATSFQDSGGISEGRNMLIGAWAAYLVDGDHGPTAEVYDFWPDGKFRTVVFSLPPKEGAFVENGAYAINGTYRLKGNTIYLNDSKGSTKTLKIDVKEDLAFITLDQGAIRVLQRVR